MSTTLRALAIRLGLGLITLFLAVTVAFFMVRGSGDPVAEILGASATPERIATLQHELGLDRPLGAQYFEFLGQLLHGDLGQSLRYSTSNASLILDRLPATLELTAWALFIAAAFGIPLGTLAAIKEGTWIDRVTAAIVLFGNSVPVFWLGLMLILIFAVQLGWLPVGQRVSPTSVILPALTLATVPLGQVARLVRSSVSETLGEQFIMASRARGLSGWSINIRHALRNSLIPVLTVFGLQLGSLLSGAVTIEFVFSWPGLGSLAQIAVSNRDFTLVQAVVVVGVALLVLVNFVIDILYTVIDPRIRKARS